MARLTIGVDIGGTKLRAGLVEGRKKICKTVEFASQASQGKEAILTAVERGIRGLWDERVSAIGVGIAGITDHAKGTFIAGPNFSESFRDVPMARLLQTKFRRPVALDNDVHCFTLAEATLGVGKGKRVVVGMTLGTGVGGGVAINGKILRGKNNAVGEFGHMVVSMGDETCSCGRRGHLEAYASGKAMQKLYTDRTGRTIEAIEVEKLADQGDVVATEVVTLMGQNLAAGFANIIHVLNPDVIVVGGGLVRMSILLRSATTVVKEMLVLSKLAETPIIKSSLGGEAGILGASLLTEREKKA